MRIERIERARGGRTAAYTFVEVIIAVLILGLMIGSLYAGFSSGFTIIQSAQENLRATQILVRKTESVRLLTWSQVLDTNYLTPTFVEYYDPLGASTTLGARYTGTLTASIDTNLPAAYQTNVRTISISLYWTNYNGAKRIVRSRQMETRVAKNGMQNYVWGAL